MHRLVGINGMKFRWGTHPSGDIFKKIRNPGHRAALMYPIPHSNRSHHSSLLPIPISIATSDLPTLLGRSPSVPLPTPLHDGSEWYGDRHPYEFWRRSGFYHRPRNKTRAAPPDTQEGTEKKRKRRRRRRSKSQRMAAKSWFPPAALEKNTDGSLSPQRNNGKG